MRYRLKSNPSVILSMEDACEGWLSLAPRGIEPLDWELVADVNEMRFQMNNTRESVWIYGDGVSIVRHKCDSSWAKTGLAEREAFFGGLIRCVVSRSDAITVMTRWPGGANVPGPDGKTLYITD